LRFGRLTGCLLSVKPPPVVDRFRVGHATWMPVFNRPTLVLEDRDGELC